MFGIGLGEIIVIFIILVIFIRPEDLPKFLRNAGRFYGKAKKMYNEVIQIKDQILKEINDATTLDTPPDSTAKDQPKNTTAIIAEALPKPQLEAPPVSEPETVNPETPSVQAEIKEGSSKEEQAE